MKKWFLVLSCVCALSLVVLMPLAIGAEDSNDIYYYTFTPTLPYSGPTVRASLPKSFVCAKDSVSTLDNSVVFHTGDSVTTSGANFDTNAGTCKISCTVNDTSTTVIIAIGEPFYIYSYESTLPAVTSGTTLTGTLYVEPSVTTAPEITSGPSAYGTSVSDGVTSGISYVGLVFSSILNSPVFIFVGLAVGCYLVTLSISKVKDLIKGY